MNYRDATERTATESECASDIPVRLYECRATIAGLWIAALLLLAPTVDAQDRTAEYKLKVAYLYNFCTYVKWPENASFEANDSPIVIGVLGKDPFGSALDELAARKTVGSHPIVIKRFVQLNDVQSCHLLFVASTNDAEVRKKIQVQLADSPTLLVGENPGYAAQGADVNFFVDADGTIGFEMNAQAIAAKQLMVNARLAKIATIVNP